MIRRMHTLQAFLKKPEIFVDFIASGQYQGKLRVNRTMVPENGDIVCAYVHDDDPNSRLEIARFRRRKRGRGTETWLELFGSENKAKLWAIEGIVTGLIPAN